MEIVINKENLEKLGYIDQKDRGMAENGGFLFEHPYIPNVQVRLWTGHARMQVVYGERIVFDTMDILF